MDPKVNIEHIEQSAIAGLSREILERVHREQLQLCRRKISGTYKTPFWYDTTIIELRVDVDGKRPQQRISGDVFRLGTCGAAPPWPRPPVALDRVAHAFWYCELYEYSFVVNAVTWTDDGDTDVLTGPIVYYDDPTNTDETIEVRIPRVSILSTAADATVSIRKSGTLIATHILPKISEYFRTVDLEIDRFQGTPFPPVIGSDISPSPADLPAQDVSVRSAYADAGIDMTVTEDDVLNDPDSIDVGDNWDEGELHDLMEDRFDSFVNRLQWKTYGVVVPKFGDPHYDSSYYGTMFDWGGWQAGDTYFRQGAAVADDAIRARSSGTLYDTAEEQDRFFLWTFCHEVGHSFNLPHVWSRTASPDTASVSFMNYPWDFTGGTGGENAYWSNFRWQFDDLELVWMRHQNRIDVIFGGNDWIGNNLTAFIEPQLQIEHPPLRLDLACDTVLDFAEPVRVELRLTNISPMPQPVIDRLDPEDRLVTIYIRRPNGEIVRYVPPIRRLKFPGDFVVLDPGESIRSSTLLSFGATGLQFETPGEYRVRAYYGKAEEAVLVSAPLRFRVAAPTRRVDEELAHLLSDRNAAKFLYFAGSARYPEITSRLEEAVQRFEKTNPRVVRHLQAALGIHATREYKRVIEKGGKRVITASRADLAHAIAHLDAALSPTPDTKRAAVDDARFVQLGTRLAQCYLDDGQTNAARKTLDRVRDQVKDQPDADRLVQPLQERLKKTPERKPPKKAPKRKPAKEVEVIKG